MKWFDEKLLQLYWTECHKEITYALPLPDGRRIRQAHMNPVFDAYPDIKRNLLSDGTIVPCEVEWETTSFERHGHDIEVLKKEKGFLVVYSKNSAFPLPQVEINRSHFKRWLKNNSTKIMEEIETGLDKPIRTGSDPKCWLLYIGGKQSKKNLAIALREGVWGFPELGRKGKSTRGLMDVKEIKKGDIFIFVSGFTLDKSVNTGKRKLRGRLSLKQFRGHFDKISAHLVTESLYIDGKRKLWGDKKYPYRIGFQPIPVFQRDYFPCNKRLGSLRDVIRVVYLGGRPAEIAATLLAKLISTVGTYSPRSSPKTRSRLRHTPKKAA